MNNIISNTDDTIDIRDVIERINYLQDPSNEREDDDELNAEFDGHMEEELAAESSKVDLGRAVEIPISLPAAGTKKIMTEEEGELAELRAAVAG